MAQIAVVAFMQLPFQCRASPGLRRFGPDCAIPVGGAPISRRNDSACVSTVRLVSRA
jgi:hypothetical protein